MAVERKQLLMGGGAVLVLVIAVTMLQPASAPTRPPAATNPAAARPRAAARGQQKVDPAAPVAPVKLKALSETRGEPGEPKRNPFRFQPKVVAPPPITKPVVVPPPPVVDPPKPGPPPVPPPPPIPLKFIGVLERANGVKWAVLSDGKTPTPMYGKDGDIIDGRYQIVKIGTESIEMTYTDGRGRTVIRLTGQ
jgi:hypothetical protein